MKPEAVDVVVPTREIPYVIDVFGLVHWDTPCGRQWVFDHGVLIACRGNRFTPMTRVPDYQAGIQWSLGFSAGRDLPFKLPEVKREM